MLGFLLIFGGIVVFLGAILSEIVIKSIVGEVEGRKDFRGDFEVLKKTRVPESRRRKFGYSDENLMLNWLEGTNERRVESAYYDACNRDYIERGRY